MYIHIYTYTHTHTHTHSHTLTHMHMSRWASRHMVQLGHRRAHWQRVHIRVRAHVPTGTYATWPTDWFVTSEVFQLCILFQFISLHDSFLPSLSSSFHSIPFLSFPFSFTYRALFISPLSNWHLIVFIPFFSQLFINHKLKSVSHLPWKFLIFRFLNTFIDDLFAFGKSYAWHVDMLGMCVVWSGVEWSVVKCCVVLCGVVYYSVVWCGVV